jgi:uncharacterized protein
VNDPANEIGRPTAAETGRRPDEAALAEIVRRIVEAARPEKIILFGSAARGEMGRNSDVDLLVVKSGSYGKLDLLGKIRMNLWGVGEAVDVILATPEELDRYGDCPAIVFYPAIREGRVLYGLFAVPNG